MRKKKTKEVELERIILGKERKCPKNCLFPSPPAENYFC